MTPDAISVSRDSLENEIPSDRPMHENTTAGNGGFNWDAKHYAEKHSAGKGSEAPKATSVSVNPHAANRGDES
jgi:hypothetical protein